MEKEKDVFVISLDAVDLNLLPIYQRHSDVGAVPLWKSNMGSQKKNYYEFVIKTDNINEDVNEPDIEYTTCHVCDMNVPKVYLNEHKKCFRHKFNRQVADTEINKPQLYVNDGNNKRLPSKYYCIECSIVIDNKDEATHKLTIEHRNSVILEKLLKFSLTDANERVNEDIENIVPKEFESSEQDSVTNKSITKTKIENEIKDDLNSKIISNSCELNISRPSFDSKDGKITFTVKNGPEVNTFIVDGVDYDAIIDFFSTYYCMICNATFARQNLQSHVIGTQHEQNLRQKSIDKNCVRKLNSCRYHCVLCRDYFDGYDHHVNRAMHLKNFRDKMVTADNDNLKATNENTAPVNNELVNSLKPSTSTSVTIDETVVESKETVKNDPNSYFCDVCQVKVPNNVGNIKDHNDGRPHIRNLKHTKADYQMKKIANSNFVTCIVCNLNLTNNDNNISTHVQGKAHKKIYKEFCASNYIVWRKERPFCKACEVQVGIRNEFEHCSGKNHKKNLKDLE